jgi:hypothetical protein
VCANAQFAYLLTASSISALPAENFGGVDQKPEQNAANWFQSTFVNAGKGQFVSIADLKAGLSNDVKVLWINIYRVGIEKLADAGLDDAAIAAVKNFVANGGQLYLTKQATLIAHNIGRMGYAPSWASDGYTNGGDVWSINARLGMAKEISEKFDRSSHPIFKDLLTNNNGTWDDYEGQLHHFELFPMVGAVARTDNNNFWGDLFRKDPGTGGAMPETEGVTHYNNLEPLRLTEFESDWNCTVLAVWGHVLDFCAAGLIEFKPVSGFDGYILINGFAAYQWGTSNDYIANVKQLTKNALEYLLSKAGGSSAFESIQSDVKATKIIRNGQLLIERNGVLYTITGAVL